MTTNTFSVTIPNLTALQIAAIESLLNETTTTRKSHTKKAAPQATVSEEEDEDFGSEETEGEEIEDEDDNEDEDETPAVTFDQVKAAINKYGATHANEMRAILKAHKAGSTKELSTKPKQWESVLNKVNVALKKLKKK